MRQIIADKEQAELVKYILTDSKIRFCLSQKVIRTLALQYTNILIKCFISTMKYLNLRREMVSLYFLSISFVPINCNRLTALSIADWKKNILSSKDAWMRNNFDKSITLLRFWMALNCCSSKYYKAVDVSGIISYKHKMFTDFASSAVTNKPQPYAFKVHTIPETGSNETNARIISSFSK